MNVQRNSVWLVPLILLCTFPLWRIPVGSFLTPRVIERKTDDQNRESHNFKMETVKILQNQKGEKTALIQAQSANTEENRDVLALEKVEADLFDEDGNVTHIVSQKGKYNTATEVLTLIDDVVINKIHDKQFLYTDLLHYNSRKRTVTCPGETLLLGEDVRIEGGNLHYDINLSQYDIGGGVQVELRGFTPPSGTPVPQSATP